MKFILKDESAIIIRFDKGEEVIEGLKKIAVEERIYAAWFSGIGAAMETILSYYDTKRKEYQNREYKEDMQIASLLGNIGLTEGKPAIHCHGTFSDRSMKTVAGHVKKLVVSATCEIMLTVLEGSIEREYSEEIGLHLMK